MYLQRIQRHGAWMDGQGGCQEGGDQQLHQGCLQQHAGLPQHLPEVTGKNLCT